MDLYVYDGTRAFVVRARAGHGLDLYYGEVFAFFSRRSSYNFFFSSDALYPLITLHL